MNDLVLQAAALQRTMDARGWRSCIIGGLAVIRWGEPRFTRDVDVSLFTGLGGEEGAARALLEQFSPRISDALNFALENRVLLLEGPSGIAIDIALAAFPFEAAIIDRASDHEYLPETMLRTVSAEDLIVLKAFANRRRRSHPTKSSRSTSCRGARGTFPPPRTSSSSSSTPRTRDRHLFFAGSARRPISGPSVIIM